MSNPTTDPTNSSSDQTNTAYSRAPAAPVDNSNRVSQLIGNVNVNSLIQSNSFLRNDLDNLIDMSQVNVRNNMPGSHSHENENANPTIINIQGQNNLGQEAPDQQGEQPNDAGEHSQPSGLNIWPLLVSSLQSSFPFFLLLVAKIFHQHLLGFFIVLGFMTTLHWSNRNFVHQVELRGKKQNKKLCLLILFLLLNIFIFFLIFSDYKLYNCLIFLSPNLKKMDTWNLIWIVVCSDTIVKYINIIIKASITLLPFRIMPLRKRGNYYSLIESVTLFYRSLTPIHPWILFLFYADHNIQLSSNDAGSNASFHNQESTTFIIFLIIFYSICKLNQLFTIFNQFRTSYKDIKGDMSFCAPTSVNEGEDNTCPICQDKLSGPVVLKCKHVFCEDCVCVWLDKENSCPMCRTKITIKKPVFKDGTTSIFVQWF